MYIMKMHSNAGRQPILGLLLIIIGLIIGLLALTGLFLRLLCGYAAYKLIDHGLYWYSGGSFKNRIMATFIHRSSFF